MASCLQFPMASSYSIASSTTFLTSSKNRVSSIKTRFRINCRSRHPVRYDPNESLIKNLTSIGPPEYLQHNTLPDELPLLDILDSPTLMASHVQMRQATYNKRARERSPAPDLPSILFEGRVVYIGMPLVPAVTELIVAELMYLQWVDTKAPIFIYVNSTGTSREDGEMVAMETEGFAIYDTMMLMENKIYTLGLGYATGQACLILSAGTKGNRFMLPHAQAMLHEPRIPPAGLRPASDVAIRAKEVILNRDTLVTLFAKHTGNSEEVVANVMRGPYYMDAKKAKDFGVIDEILSPPDKTNKADARSRQIDESGPF